MTMISFDLQEHAEFDMEVDALKDDDESIDVTDEMEDAADSLRNEALIDFDNGT